MSGVAFSQLTIIGGCFSELLERDSAFLNGETLPSKIIPSA